LFLLFGTNSHSRCFSQTANHQPEAGPETNVYGCNMAYPAEGTATNFNLNRQSIKKTIYIQKIAKGNQAKERRAASKRHGSTQIPANMACDKVKEYNKN